MIVQKRLDNSVWAYLIASSFRTLIGMPTYKLEYGKSCHLSLEPEHRVVWAVKKFNLDMGTASNHNLNETNDLDEFRVKTYKISSLYKEKIRKYHNQKIEKRDFFCK